MLYQVSRNGQKYGPYSLEDLQRYVASGNVLSTDMVKSDDMADWIPVSQMIGVAPAVPLAYPPSLAPNYPAAGSLPLYPDAPNLSWGLVLLFAFFTCGLFTFIWNLVLAEWMKRVQPSSKAILYYVAAAVLLFCQLIVGPHTHVMNIQPGFQWWTLYTAHPLRIVIGLAIWVVRLIARFTLRSELEQHFNNAEPVGLSLSGVLTFFFGGLYFQYHLNRINELKRMARYRGAAI